MPEPLKIYVGNKRYSSWSLRPYLALHQLGVPFEEEVIDLYAPDAKQRIRAVSRAGKVPVLVHGSRLIWESLAICEYLAELHPAAKLWPQDAGARALARSVANEMHAGFAELRKNLPFDCRARNKAPVSMTPEVRADIARVQEIWKQCRAAASGQKGELLFGHFTVADAMYAPVVSRFVTYAVEVEPETRAYMDAVWSLPGMKAWTAAAEKETSTAPY